MKLPQEHRIISQKINNMKNNTTPLAKKLSEQYSEQKGQDNETVNLILKKLRQSVRSKLGIKKKSRTIFC